MVQNNDLLDDLNDNVLDDLDNAFGDDWTEEPAPAETKPAEQERNIARDADREEPDEDFPGQLAVDVYEKDDKLIIKARTAGVDKKDLNVSISEGILTISGTLSGGDEIEGTDFHIQECYWGEFTRTLALPVPVDEEAVSAVLKEGVLTITFDKLRQESGKVIDIQQQ